MKLSAFLKEADTSGVGNTAHPGSGPTYSTWAPFSNISVFANHSADTISDGTKITRQVEKELIDYAIDVLFNTYPNLVKRGKIKRYIIQQLLGQITSGRLASQVSIQKFIEKLNQNKIEVD